MKKKLIAVFFMFFLFVGINSFAYKAASVTLYGDYSGSVTITVNDLSSLMGLLNSDSINLSTVQIPPITANVAYSNFNNSGTLITGGFDIIANYSSYSSNIILDGGPVYYGDTPISFNNLTFNVSLYSGDANCSSGNITVGGYTASCSEINSAGLTLDLLLMVLLF